MGPKKGKDITDDDNYWRLCIEHATLDDESWKVKVIIIEAAGSDQDHIYLNKFETCAAEERRFVIKNICKTETIFMINQLGGEKKVKDDNLRVFEEGQAFLKEKEEVPPEIMALIIKHLILKMKDEYLFIQHQRLEVQEGMKKESVTMINKLEVKGTANVKLPEPDPELPPVKGKKGEQPIDNKPIEIDQNKKYSTLLRVRGEEWRDKVYIDDYPLDGPNLYIAVTGFLDPNLPGCLIKVGIPLTAVVQIRIDPTNNTIPSSLFRATKRGQNQTELLAEKSHGFWEDLQQLRINKNSADDFKNTAFIIFSPPYWSMEKLSGHHEKIYDELCYLMYDIQDLTRQHNHYLQNMDIITVPEDEIECHYQQIYRDQIDGIPLESVTIYSILDAVLTTVCKNQNIYENSSMMSSDNMEHSYQNNKEQNQLQKSEKLIKDLIKNLRKIDYLKNKYRITFGAEYENYNNPSIIDNGDFCKFSTFHLGNINLDNIVYSMLFGMPINKLWLNRNKPVGEIRAKINFHLNTLLSCFDRNDIEMTELKRLIHILACRKVYNNRSALKRKHLQPSTIAAFKKSFLKRSVLAEPLPRCTLYVCSSSSTHSINSAVRYVDESNKSITIKTDDESCRTKFLFDCPDISELASATEIISQKPMNHMIDDFEFFEDFTGISAFQIIIDAFNKFNCVNYKYCEVTDCFILMFYNSHNTNGIAREEWRCHLTTSLCLQDFFDFVLEEHYDWIKNEEKNYDENNKLRSQSESKDSKNQVTGKSCIENTEIGLELLMEGSLKYKEVTEIDEITPETSNSKMISSKKTISPASNTDLDSKASKKNKTLLNLIPKFSHSVEDGEVHTEIPKKPFSGYDLGDRRVEVFGKDSTFFSEDGTRVSTFYSLLIPMNLEFVTLNVVPGDGENEFWIHKSLGEPSDSNIIDTCESFRIKTRDQLSIYVKKQLCEIPLCILNPFSADAFQKSNVLRSPSPVISNSTPQVFEMKSFYSLFITWPNGLITESVHENNSPTISHIKQFYVTNSLNLSEDMRCISLNGEVIIFKCNGDIEVLKPDSSYFKISKYEKRLVNEVISEEMQSAGSDKSKKRKGKEKGKDKPNKVFSKSSKNVLEFEENLANSKAPDYELFIEEFEVIESNGCKQKWINEIGFEVEKLLIRTATDFCLGEIFSRRMDGTNTLLNKDGVLIVTFPNNTRIITSYIIGDESELPEWTDEEKEYLSFFDVNIETDTLKSKDSGSQKNNRAHSTESFSSRNFEDNNNKKDNNNKGRIDDGYVSIYLFYSIEHPNFTTITINKYNGNISIESPNNTCVILDSDNNYKFSLDEMTTANFNGQNLNISYLACNVCRSYSNCEVKIKSEEINSVSEFPRNWLKMSDSFGKKIIINEEGNINIIQSSDKISRSCESQKEEDFVVCEDEIKETKRSSSSTNISHTKCMEMYQAKSLKFFVLRRDLTCSELVHRIVIEQYKQEWRDRPWCTINEFDAFGDNRSLWSILTPIYLSESEKWVMESKLSEKPKYLTYKDLKIDGGKGFYHWMRPYKRFKPKPMKPHAFLPERLPRAFILRTLEQQWREKDREKLNGAKELLNAILRYRYLMEADSKTLLSFPIQDPRTDSEQKTDKVIQAISQRIHDNLKKHLAEDVQKRAKTTITTKSQRPSKASSVQEEFDEDTEEFKIFENVDTVKQVESAEEMSPNLERYWRRRAEEYKEEQFYRYLLRQDSVPPYFRNVLGGAIWWEVNKAADHAVTTVNRKNMKRVCDDQ